MGGNFRRGENTEVLPFSTRLSVQPSTKCKINGESSRICMKLCDWMIGNQSSIESSSILKNYIVCLKLHSRLKRVQANLHFRFVDFKVGLAFEKQKLPW